MNKPKYYHWNDNGMIHAIKKSSNGVLHLNVTHSHINLLDYSWSPEAQVELSRRYTDSDDIIIEEISSEQFTEYTMKIYSEFDKI